jgi:hypothetical protein
MKPPLLIATIAAAAATLIAALPVSAEPLSGDEFREHLMGVPLCGTPASGPLMGKTLCTVHLPDGTAVVAGAGILVRGVWEADGSSICRRNPDDPLERRRCVEYERIGEDRYRNTDGVEVCIGPCP